MKKTVSSVFGRLSVVALFVASASHASFDDYRNRDAERFAIKQSKPFKADKDVVSVVMREGVPRGGGYTYQYLVKTLSRR
jgi:hypothetical protein